jgi:hypothetical protein
VPTQLTVDVRYAEIPALSDESQITMAISTLGS